MPPAIDALLIGHVCRDETPDGPRLGGTVTFSGLTARALGLRTGIITSAPDDLLPLMAPLDGLAVSRVASEQATTFVNRYTPQGRRQTITGQAARLGWDDIPDGWRGPDIVHIGPVADEIDPALTGRFPGSLVGVTPQGWMRAWDEAGHVRFKGWTLPETVLRSASAAVFSIEDVQGDEALAAEMARQCPVVAVTRGAAGCTLFVDGSAQHIPAHPKAETDPTGAGDIFAMAFFVRLRASGDPAAAARFASTLAGHSVTRTGLHSIPTQAEIAEALRPA